MTIADYRRAAHELAQARWDARQTELGKRFLEEDLALSIYFSWYGFLKALPLSEPVVNWVWEKPILQVGPIKLQFVKLDLVEIPD